MTESIPGIHHVTGIAGPPQQNFDFFAGVLGLRFVKQTVNFDDPQTYHFYFGDAAGRPGTLATFFPWAGARAGRRGAGQAAELAFAAPAGSLAYWAERLRRRGAPAAPEVRFGAEALRTRDPDGLPVLLIGAAPDEGGAEVWDAAVPAEAALRSVHSVTLSLARTRPTEAFLTEVFGYRRTAEKAGSLLMEAPGGAPASALVLTAAAAPQPGAMGSGALHHVAFRASGPDAQEAWRERLQTLGFRVTPVQERVYFRSIYFHEPGGVLFEIATDAPGFAADEPSEALGQRLMLPPWLENRRDLIESALPPLKLPTP